MLIEDSVVSYYLPQLASNVGITSTDTKLILNIGYAVEGYIFATAGARLHDVFGRRKMLLCATAGLIVSLAIAAGTAAGYVNTGSKTSSSASIGFIFVFGAIFAFGFTAMQPIYPAEVMANDMRAKGMGTYKIVGGAAGFVNTFAAPIALSHVSLYLHIPGSFRATLSYGTSTDSQQIGYWFYVFFVFWDMFEFAFMYFFFVETKGLTLEEMDDIFEAKNPRKASTEKKKIKVRTVLDGEGKIQEEIVAKVDA